MRMWMVDPKVMCRQHLLGEHSELHKFLPSWRKQVRIDGRIAGNAMEPLSYEARHEALVAEMEARGYTHQSPLDTPDFSYLPVEQVTYRVDRDAALAALVGRCAGCRQRMEGLSHE